ncbi:N-acetylglucosamine-6-sulfatase-like isoform X3 [Drosophila navojoa]|uniref:N-acetylglucosamine-6-sulfatase-like isoform X3 n=1 Tax=Drosophila navojoa TaxID=7232 RepID=UPI0008474BFC|nr:N-acetylglucosamine-6-sulfatase-like isoform X3 [Drosophila navojoa]
MQINMILYISILFYIDHTFGLVQVVPNVLLLLTDDQDVELHGLHPLQKTTQFLTEYGTKFTNAYTSTPLCCPARASLLTDKHWLVRTAKHLPNSTVLTVDKYFQKRWETLLAVDEMMVTIVTLLKKYQCLDNTYIIYTSDNGYHLGQFAQPFDKRQPYQTDIKVPLLIRGPDVPGNILLNFAVSLVDLMPTILEWVGLTVPNYVDGRSFKDELLQQHQTKRHSHRILLVEYWGEGNDETYNSECPEKQTDHLAECTLDADCHCQDAWNNTYTCIRDFRYKLDRIYCEFYDTEHFIEAYDLIQDPYQLKNIAYELLPSERTEYGFLIANLTICAGKSCHINY